MHVQKARGGTTSTVTTTTTTTPVVTNTNKFQVLAYEFSVPVSYAFRKFVAEFTPVYAIAVHNIDDDGINTFYVPNTSVFYFQLAVSYRF
jgi:hypothetical protein